MLLSRDYCTGGRGWGVGVGWPHLYRAEAGQGAPPKSRSRVCVVSMAGERISFFFLGSLVLFGVVVGNDIDVNFEDNYKFTVSIGNEEWFRSGGLQVRHQNQLWSSDNKAGYHLKLASPPAKEEGNDPIGFFNKLL